MKFILGEEADPVLAAIPLGTNPLRRDQQALELAYSSAVPRQDVRRASVAHAFRLARRRFVACERLDMQSLAQELGVDRSTLFRWVGNRDELIAAIIVSFIEPVIVASDEQTDRVGGARIALAAYNYAESILASTFFQTYLRRESDRAIRLLTSRSSPVQAEIVRVFERMLEQERDRGNLEHVMTSHDLAYLITRIIESFVYSDIITGDIPDANKIRAAVGALLHVTV
jgi:AcrR family transcriptional regulator